MLFEITNTIRSTNKVSNWINLQYYLNCVSRSKLPNFIQEKEEKSLHRIYT